jgi:nucleoside-diphosphate-sugar epimerase
MFVITGASGNTGSVVATELLDAGRKVRLLARDPARVKALADRGAEVVAGDVFDEATFARAAAGAEGLYLLSPPDARATDFIASRRLLQVFFSNLKDEKKLLSDKFLQIYPNVLRQQMTVFLSLHYLPLPWDRWS